MIEDCPKCYTSGLEPKWHSANDPRCTEKNFHTQSEEEHLHYKCKCGYDFIKPIQLEQ